jgi:hypothetical protein
MRAVLRIALPFLFVLLTGFLPTAQAQELPVADVSAGYSFLFVAKGYTLRLNGGNVAVAYNLNRWVGVVGDFGGSKGHLIQNNYFLHPF